MGTQYRTGVYYTDDKDLEVINQVFDEVAKKYDQPLAVERRVLQNFVVAEDYHQDYLKKIQMATAISMSIRRPIPSLMPANIPNQVMKELKRPCHLRSITVTQKNQTERAFFKPLLG